MADREQQIIIPEPYQTPRAMRGDAWEARLDGVISAIAQAREAGPVPQKRGPMSIDSARLHIGRKRQPI